MIWKIRKVIVFLVTIYSVLKYVTLVVHTVWYRWIIASRLSLYFLGNISLYSDCKSCTIESITIVMLASRILRFNDYRSILMLSSHSITTLWTCIWDTKWTLIMKPCTNYYTLFDPLKTDNCYDNVHTVTSSFSKILEEKNIPWVLIKYS